MSTLFQQFAAATLSLALAGASTASLARQTQRSVSHADLDLTTAKGKRALDRRVASAITQLCGEPGAARSGFELKRVNDCRWQAEASVAPQLAALLDGKTARELAISLP